MATQQTEKSRYPSKYSPGNFVPAAQYIIEMVLEQYAHKQKRELPLQFWKLPEWDTLYKGQLRITHSLLKKYSAKAIISVVTHRRLDNIRPKWVEDLIKREQNRLNVIERANTPSEVQLRENLANLEKIREIKEVKIAERKVKPNKLSRLLEMDELL